MVTMCMRVGELVATLNTQSGSRLGGLSGAGPERQRGPRMVT